MGQMGGREIMMEVLLMISGMVVTILAIPMIKKMLENSGMKRENFRGDMIPVGMGICFLPALVINSIILLYCNVELSRLMKVYILLFGMISMCFAGVIDDALGNRGVTGLKGHFKALCKGHLTTGAFKAIMGLMVGFLISVTVTEDLARIAVGTLVIALSTNFMNLLDLRPGRTLKMFLFIGFLMFCTCSAFERQLMTLVLPAALIYFKLDVKAKSMMGDAGSNLLGISIGIFFVLFYSLKVQIIWLVAMILIHLIAEKFSITKIIEKSKILNGIDKLGRK